MTVSATSGRHLWKFEKTAQNAACNGFGSNFCGAAFCLPHHVVGILLRRHSIVSLSVVQQNIVQRPRRKLIHRNSVVGWRRVSLNPTNWWAFLFCNFYAPTEAPAIACQSTKLLICISKNLQVRVKGQGYPSRCS